MKWLKLFQEVVGLCLIASVLVCLWLVIFAGISEGVW